MLNRRLINLLSILVLLGFVSACGEGEDRQEKYLERAKTFFEEEKYVKARIEASNVLQINPKNAQARQLLGEISFNDGDIRKAYGMFLSVIDAEPDNIDAHMSMSKIYLAVKDHDKTIEHANKVLALEPKNAQAMGYKALSLVGLGEIEKGEAIAIEALAIDAGIIEAVGVLVQKNYNAKTPEEGLKLLEQAQLANPEESRLVSMKISLLETMGRKDAVEQELVGLTKTFPEDRRYASTLAKYYIRESKLDLAESALRDYAKNNPEDIDAKLSVVSFLLQQVSKDKAVEEVNKYLKDDPDESKLSIGLAQLHLFTGDTEEAAVALRQTVDRDPRSVGSIEARNLLVGIYLNDQKFDTAKALLDEIFDIEPENTVALLTRARLSLSENKVKDGIGDLRVVLKNDPESAIALKLLAGAQEREGSEGLALDNYKKLMSIEKPDLQVLASAARLAIQAEQYQEAEGYIRQALELDANNGALVTNLVRLLVLKEDWETARAFAQRLVDSEDSKALGYFLQAGLDARLDDSDAAIVNLKASVKAEPKAVESLTSLATTLAQNGKRAEAIDYVNKHCDSYPDQAHCRHILGSLYGQDNKLDKAIVEFENALAINDQQVVTYRQLAKVYAAQGDREGVSTVLKRGIDASNNQDLAFELANFYYQIKEYNQSRDIYLAMIDENAASLPAKNNLAMLYAEYLNSPENVKKARALIADLQDSENPAYLDTVGWVFYLTGEYERAVTYLQAAVDQVGSSGLLQYHLGMAFYKLGDMDNAKTHLALAVENKEARYTGFDIAEATLAEIQ